MAAAEPTKHYLDASQPAPVSHDFSAITLADVDPAGGGLAYPGPGTKARDHLHPRAPKGFANFMQKLRDARRPYREYLAEFMGTMILILFGDGVVAQVVLSNGAAGGQDAIHWTWGFGVLFGIYTAGGISGAHLNPAVTLTNCLLRGGSWHKLPGYWFSQIFGAYIAGLIVFGNYRDAFASFDPNLTMASAGVFNTYPIPLVSIGFAFFEEVLATAILLFLIYAITDPNNVKPAAGLLQPLMIAFVVVAIGMAFGWQTGYAINPARDLGPRMAAATVGFGGKVFWFRHYAWLPVVAPLIGGPLGGFLYDVFIYDPPTEISQGEI